MANKINHEGEKEAGADGRKEAKVRKKRKGKSVCERWKYKRKYKREDKERNGNVRQMRGVRT